MTLLDAMWDPEYDKVQPDRFAILDSKGNVQPASLRTWGEYLKSSDRRVAGTILANGYSVSTVFLGLNHQYGEGPPLWFETMVFGPKRKQEIFGKIRMCLGEDLWMKRCETRDQALAMHKEGEAWLADYLNHAR